MLGAILLTLCISICLIFAYYIEQGDVFSPSVLVCLAFLLSSFAAIYNTISWGAEIHFETTLIIILGLVIFIACSSIFGKSAWLSVARGRESKANHFGLILIEPKFVAAVSIIGVAISVLYVKEIIGSSFTGGNWSEVMASYRTATAYVTDDAVQIPTWLNYSYRLFMAFSYVMLFLLVNNYVESGRVYASYAVSPTVYCVSSFAQASRGQVLIFIFAGFVMGWVALQRKRRGKMKVPFKYIPRGIFLLIIVLIAFVALGEVVGRSTVKTPLGSLMTYMGGSIVGLDAYLQNPSVASSYDGVWGAETFRGINLFLSGLLDDPKLTYTFQLEYRLINGNNIGNLYTAFRYYIHDFGIIGMIVLVAAQGLFFGAFYKRITVSSSSNALFPIVLYGYLAICIAYMPLSDYFFHQYVSPTAILTFGMLWLAAQTVERFSVPQDPRQSDCLPSS